MRLQNVQVFLRHDDGSAERWTLTHYSKDICACERHWFGSPQALAIHYGEQARRADEFLTSNVRSYVLADVDCHGRFVQFAACERKAIERYFVAGRAVPYVLEQARELVDFFFDRDAVAATASD